MVSFQDATVVDGSVGLGLKVSYKDTLHARYAE